jgi:hypothetical protein
MRIKKPRQASLDEVRITRDGDTATIENADPSISVVHLKVGPALASMTDAAVLDLFNAVIASQQELAAEYDGTLIEIPPGRPQIRYSELCEQWVPRGDVLRCHIDDDESGEAVIAIDDQELNLRDFGRLLQTFAGWGMRIAFVPEDRTADEPEIIIAEPDDLEPEPR